MFRKGRPQAPVPCVPSPRAGHTLLRQKLISPQRPKKTNAEEKPLKTGEEAAFCITAGNILQIRAAETQETRGHGLRDVQGGGVGPGQGREGPGPRVMSPTPYTLAPIQAEAQ